MAKIKLWIEDAVVDGSTATLWLYGKTEDGKKLQIPLTYQEHFSKLISESEQPHDVLKFMTDYADCLKSRKLPIILDRPDTN